MATCGLGRNSVEPGSGRRRFGFTQSVTGRDRIAGNESFTRAQSITDAENATTAAGASQYAVTFTESSSRVVFTSRSLPVLSDALIFVCPFQNH